MRTVKAGAPSELERRWRGLTSGPLQVPERRWRDARRSTAASGGVACIDGIDITFGAPLQTLLSGVSFARLRALSDLIRRNVRSDPHEDATRSNRSSRCLVLRTLVLLPPLVWCVRFIYLFIQEDCDNLCFHIFSFFSCSWSCMPRCMLCKKTERHLCVRWVKRNRSQPLL